MKFDYTAEEGTKLNDVKFINGCWRIARVGTEKIGADEYKRVLKWYRPVNRQCKAIVRCYIEGLK